MFFFPLQYLYQVESSPVTANQNKIKLSGLLTLLSNISYSQVLVFSNYQTIAQSTADYLNARGYPAIYMSASQNQTARLQAIQAFKQFSCRILCSTDLTARGIDAENVNLVVNLEVPWDENTYLHRIGRGGRFGSRSVAVTIASEGRELTGLQKIIHKTGSVVKVLPGEIPKDLRNSKFIDLPVLEALAPAELAACTPEEAKSSEEKPTAAKDKSKKIKKRGRKKPKQNGQSLTNESLTNNRVEIEGKEERKTQSSPSEDRITEAIELLKSQHAMYTSPQFDELPTFGDIEKYAGLSEAGGLVDLPLVRPVFKRDSETEQSDRNVEVGKAVKLLSDYETDKFNRDKQMVLNWLSGKDLKESLGRILGGEKVDDILRSESQTAEAQVIQDAKSRTDGQRKEDQRANVHEMLRKMSKRCMGEDERSDRGVSDGTGTGPESESSSGPTSESSSRNGATTSHYQDFSAAAKQQKGPAHLPSSGSLYAPGGFGSPHQELMRAWYDHWAASIRYQRSYVQYCHYLTEMQKRSKFDG